MIRLVNKKYQLQTILASNDSIIFKSFKLNYHGGLSARRTFSSFTSRVSIKLDLIIPMQINKVHKRFTQKYGHVHRIAANAANKVPKSLAPSGTMATTASTPNISPNASPSNATNYTAIPNNNPNSTIHAYQRHGVNQYTMPTPFKDQIPQQPSEPSRALIIYPKPRITAVSYYVKPKNAVVSYNANKNVSAEPAYAPLMPTQNNSTATTPNSVLPALLPSTEIPVVSAVTPEAHNKPTATSQIPFTTSLPPSSPETPTNMPPNPPPLPTTNLTRHLRPNTGELNHTAIINEINKEKIRTEPEHGIILTGGCKPQNIPKEMQLKMIKPTGTMKNINGKMFTTLINNDTTPDQISVIQCLQEMLTRCFITLDPADETATTMQLANGSYVLLGGSKHGVKLTALGQAYATKTQDKSIDETFINNSTETSDIKLMLVMPPTNNSDLLVETGLNKHLLIAHNTKNNEYYVIAYLSSKSSGYFLNNRQFKNFQEESPSNKGKTQYFVKLKQAIQLDPKDVHCVKGGEEYLAQVSVTAFDKLKEVWEEINKLPLINFNKSGITLEQDLKMCKEHDATITNKKKHPQTQDQINQHEKGKAKQKEKQAKQYIKAEQNNEGDN